LRFTQSDVSVSGSEAVIFPAYNGYLVAPAIGAEYLLSDQFSLGGEVQVRFTSSKANAQPVNGQPSGDRRNSATTMSTHGAIVLRFYVP